MITAFPRWGFDRIVIIPKTTRERYINWKNHLRDLAIRRELVKDITKLLEKDDNMQITLLAPSGYEKAPPIKQAPEASRPLVRHLELAD